MTITIQTVFETMQAGRLTDAETLCRTALQEVPDDSDLRLLLALNLQQQGRPNEAVEVYAELTRRFPDEGLHWGNYATALREVDRQDDALAAYAVSLRLAPDNMDQLINLGLLQLHRKDYLAARDTLLKAHSLDPQSALVRIHAARACSVCRDYRADDLIRPWRQWLPLDDAPQLDLADLHLLLGDANTARFLLEDLLARTPAHLPAKLLLAAVLERMNQLDQAQSLLDQITAAPREFDAETRVEIAHQRAMLALRRGQLALARETLEQVGPRTADDYAHYFTLAEVCDKLGEAEAAIRALEAAHALQLRELKLSVPYRFEPGAPILPAAVAKISIEDYQGWPQRQAPDGDASPIFIVGFPRSGTTLLEQMLDAHPGLQSMDERPFFNILSDQLGDFGIQVPQDLRKLDQAACDELRKGYLSLVSSKILRRWDTRLVDKNPLNMLWLPMIHRLFPQAKFILALRHPCDVVISNYMQNFRSSVLALACASLEKTATAYVTAMDSWLYHVDVFKPDLFVSRYEDLVADPAAQAQRIADFIGVNDATPLLQFDQHARDKGYIATPSYAQVIQPVNRKGLNRWHRYRDALAPAMPILQPMLDYWGYSTDMP
ncbi:MAG TPA: sulfotransferase [Rhodanobacter sp.]